MSLKTQAKVLRALQEQVVEPVGGAASVRVDVRVLAATNKDLPTEIRASRFREDLYFRLNVIPIFVPPLRDRADDVPRLAEYFMSELAREYGRRRKTFDPVAMSTLQRYRWPGNVREMRNVLERLMIMVPGDTIATSDLSFLDGGTERGGAGGDDLRSAARSARGVRARLHPQGARGPAGQHFPHGGRAGRRAQQPLSEDARLRHRARPARR